MKNRVIILCGGSSTRLLPESRKNFLKHFIPISNGQRLSYKLLEIVKKIDFY
jgi:mannose-1-phosphate guanylyltransferase